MKKKKIIISLLLFLIILFIIGGMFYLQNRNNPIKEKLNMLDPEKITECTVLWVNPNHESFEYTETDPQKVKAVYEALSHMKLKEKKFIIPFEVCYRGICLTQDGKKYVVCSYSMGEVLAPAGVDYMADVTNLEELEEKYGWKTILKEMILNAEKARTERLAEEAMQEQ